jgi:hypothetical protein
MTKIPIKKKDPMVFAPKNTKINLKIRKSP